MDPPLLELSRSSSLTELRYVCNIFRPSRGEKSRGVFVFGSFSRFLVPVLVQLPFAGRLSAPLVWCVPDVQPRFNETRGLVKAPLTRIPVLNPRRQEQRMRQTLMVVPIPTSSQTAVMLIEVKQTPSMFGGGGSHQFHDTCASMRP